jgi:ABC-type polysaccharide/polyol phosphate transport system ATPase subunit
MSDPAIRASSLGKVFRIWRHPSDMLKEAFTGLRRHLEFEALRDISFDVSSGTVVGIMGRNGAGKSTLLRIIAGTLDATSGDVSVAGRISAILELGTGFHPEYTGRENVLLGGLCLGLTRVEIASRFQEIVAFAELEDFINQPFRTYSSGMQARLTFAVATAVDPDILIIDEALAVGDARFQLRSFDRVRQFRRLGKSILLVSHNQMVSICDHAILLEKGRIFARGEPGVVGNIYHELLFGPRAATSATAPKRESADPAHDGKGRPNKVETAAVTARYHEETAAAANGISLSDAGNCVQADVNASSGGDAGDIAHRHSAPITSRREHRYGDGAVRIVDFYIRDAYGCVTCLVCSSQWSSGLVSLRLPLPLLGFSSYRNRSLAVGGFGSHRTPSVWLRLLHS